MASPITEPDISFEEVTFGHGPDDATSSPVVDIARGDGFDEMDEMDSDSPNESLVVKNLPYSMSKVDIQNFLMELVPIAPQTIKLFTDGNGNFRGIAFIHYSSIEESSQLFPLLQSRHVGGRTIKVEYRKPWMDKRNKNPKQYSPSTSLESPIRSPLHATSSGSLKIGSSVGEFMERRQRDSVAHSPISVSPVFVENGNRTGTPVSLEDTPLYREVKAFVDNPHQMEISFSPSLTVRERQDIYLICDVFNLNHESSGDSDARVIRIRKRVADRRLSSPRETTSSDVDIRSSSPRFSGASSSSRPVPRSRHSDFDHITSSSYSSKPSSLPKAMAGGARSLGTSPNRDVVQAPRSSSITDLQATSSNSQRSGPSRAMNLIISKGPDGSSGFSVGRGKPIQKVKNAKLSTGASEFIPRYLQQQTSNPGSPLEIASCAFVEKRVPL